MSIQEKIYKFYDTDSLGQAEYNIVGVEYKNLIAACCKYCTTFSVIVTGKESDLLKKLKRYETHKPQKISFEFEHYAGNCLKIKYYNVTAELHKTLIENTNDMFCWINGWNLTNPEDPTFYREDGSVFFTSTIHEGKCTLIVRDEDVSQIVSNPLWKLQEGNTGDGSMC